MRRTFAQVLKEGKIDIAAEYNKLFELFYGEDSRDFKSQADVISLNFREYPYRGTCLDIYEFEKYCGYLFMESPKKMDIDDLITFCEFIFNIVSEMSPKYFFDSFNQRDYINHINTLIEKLGYMSTKEDGLTIFVPKDVGVIEVSKSSLIPDNLSYRVLEYNHHSLKGNIEEKKQILIAFGNQLEPHRPELKAFNQKLEDDIFDILNNYQIRHNNSDPKNGNKYNPLLEEMSDQELEQIYDDLYQMCLLAFLALEQQERHPYYAEMKKKKKKKQRKQDNS